MTDDDIEETNKQIEREAIQDCKVNHLLQNGERSML